MKIFHFIFLIICAKIVEILAGDGNGAGPSQPQDNKGKRKLDAYYDRNSQNLNEYGAQGSDSTNEHIEATWSPSDFLELEQTPPNSNEFDAQNSESSEIPWSPSEFLVDQLPDFLGEGNNEEENIVDQDSMQEHEQNLNGQTKEYPRIVEESISASGGGGNFWDKKKFGTSLKDK